MNDTTRTQHQYAVFPSGQADMMQRNKHALLNASQKRLMGFIGAGLCFFSELIHLWLLPEQYETYFVYGLVFLLIAMTQGVIGANLLFGSRHLLTFVWINVLIIILYGFTHTIGVLVGLAFLPLPVDVWGVAATLAEVLVIVVILLLRSAAPQAKQGAKGTREHKKTGARSHQ
jgi:cobalamin biosynthesis protein CobD/CbiB